MHQQKKEKKMTTQISCAIKACNELVKNIHRDGLDRGCIATFNNNITIRQVNDISPFMYHYLLFLYDFLNTFNTFFLFMYKNFTEHKESLYRSLSGLNNVACGGTRLYDSISDVVQFFHRNGVNSRPQILVVVTDGVDNISGRSLRECAQEISNLFTNNRTNFLFLVGVGDGVNSAKMEEVFP
jgi:hypothetical protein